MARIDTASDTRRMAANRGPLVGLAVLAILLLSVGGWAGLRLTAQAQVQPIGVAVAIPGGQVTVDDIDHVTPDQLGAPLPDGAHAVRVSVFLTADQDAPLEVTGQSFLIEGRGIDAAILPSRAVPTQSRVLPGDVAQMSLIFAVPDETTDLVLVVPGGERVSAEHRDHPGDQPDDQ